MNYIKEIDNINAEDKIKLYKTYKKECEQHILMDMTKIFSIEDFIYVTIWKLTCDAIAKKIPVEKRKEYIINILNKEIDKF